MSAQIQAASALVAEDGNGWVLTDAQQRRFVLHGADQAHAEQANAARMPWPTGINAEMVSAALLKPERMPNRAVPVHPPPPSQRPVRAKRRDRIRRKVFYPLSCLVMASKLALPFAYLHFRSGGFAAYVRGVMAASASSCSTLCSAMPISCKIRSPWLTAAAPGLIYTAASLAAFGWLVLRR